MRRIVLAGCLALGAMTAWPSLPQAHACPMCKLANEEGCGPEAAAANARPRAYMYSILFMLSMPATLLAGFSLAFYRLHRKQQALLAVDGLDEAAWAHDMSVNGGR